MGSDTEMMDEAHGAPPGPRDAQAPSPTAPPRNRQRDGAFLLELGQRVRRIRAIRGLSRKHLALSSGVSERYIAQLESGLGNASIMLLRQVATAIGAQLEDLVSEAGADTREWALMRNLLRRATPEAVSEAKAVLAGERRHGEALDSGRRRSRDRVALIGLRGAGKSTLGRLAAERLGWPFVELNKAIEAETGLSIAEVFSLYGQEGYRRLELSALEQVITRQGPMILATAGGIVAEPVTFELLLSSFFTIWITATPTEHMGRVRDQGDLRPMADDKAAMAELKTILSSRESLYARAEARIDTAGTTVAASERALLEAIGAAVTP